jgi:cob(I)alamin adenosyltransferase
MTRFYTTKGDDGYTGLLGEGRVPKYHPQTEATGSVDEASAALGLARAFSQVKQSADILLQVQKDLYHLMAELAATPENANRFRSISEAQVTWLEVQTDEISSQVELPDEFIVPGDSKAGAFLSLARTIVRRAERRVAELYHTKVIENVELLRYLNRLSSLCFVLELLENRAAGIETSTLAKE